MKHTGECFHEIGELYDGQPKYDWNPFLTGINEYKCVLSTFPNILGNQKVKFLNLIKFVSVCRISP